MKRRTFLVSAAALAGTGGLAVWSNARGITDYNVYAARPDTFAQYFWKYPFLGAMPYKGFFERRDAEKEAVSLKKKGYDVLIGEVNGYIAEVSGASTSATPPVITAVENGANFQVGIAPNSWAQINGTNLSSVTDTWTEFL